MSRAYWPAVRLAGSGAESRQAVISLEARATAGDVSRYSLCAATLMSTDSVGRRYKSQRDGYTGSRRGRMRGGREGEWTLDQKRQMESFLAEVERRAFRIARYGVRNDDEALDLVQDAMLKLVKSYASKPAAEWPALFYRILDNGIKDWHRRRVVRQKVVNLFAGSGDDGRDVIAEAPDRREPGPEGRARADEALGLLESAMARLPERQRQAFLLRNLEGLDTKATAVAMGCSAGSVKTHYFRALKTLRAEIGEAW